jgi:hypothetical protein
MKLKLCNSISKGRERQKRKLSKEESLEIEKKIIKVSQMVVFGVFSLFLSSGCLFFIKFC